MTGKIILGKKIGMTQIFSETGEVLPVTVLDVSDNYISRHVKATKEGVSHYEIGKDKKRIVNKSEKGLYQEQTPKFKVVVKQSENLPEVKSIVDIDSFKEGEKVSVIGITKGKGFQGVVKRWGFHGGPRTHGASDRERAPGSIGLRTIPGRVFKGKKMGGHMGVALKNIKNLKIVKLDKENNLMLVSGAVPGARGSYLIVKSK